MHNFLKDIDQSGQDLIKKVRKIVTPIKNSTVRSLKLEKLKEKDKIKGKKFKLDNVTKWSS